MMNLSDQKILKSTAQRVFFLWAPYRSMLILNFLFLIAFAVTEAASLAFIYMVFNQTASALTPNARDVKIMAFISWVQKSIPIGDTFILSCVLLIACYFLKSLFSFLSQFASQYLSCRTKKDFNTKVFQKFIRSDYTFFLNHKHGWLMHRTMTVPAEAALLLDLIPRMAFNALKIFSIFVALFFISPAITFVMSLFAIFYYYISKLIASKISFNIGKARVGELQLQNELAAEVFAGIKQLKVSGTVGRWFEMFKVSVMKNFRLEIRDAFWLIMPPVVMEFAIFGLMTAALMVIRLFFAKSFFTILPVVVTFAYAVQRIIPTFNLLGSQRIGFGGMLPVLEIMCDVLAAPDVKNDGVIELKEFKSKILFQNVMFSYAQRNVLFKELNFDIEKGRTTAIVGPSGSGKSTIVNLILRLHEIQGGAILIDGQNLKDLSLSTWLSKVGLVSQDTFIFHGTIRENIACGLDIHSDEDIIKAAQEANAHEFIMGCPHRYDTVIGDQGMKLSGGQRQRIAIARALYRNPDVLILDEATSSLDSISESLVQEAINHISKSRTVVIIAHRLSTVINADKIVVLDQGQVISQGKHQELIGQGGLYKQLYQNS